MAMDWDTLGKKLSQLGQETRSGMQKMGESVQLNSRLNEARKDLQKQYAAIGEAVVDRFAEDIPEGFEEVFEAAAQARAKVEELEKQIRLHKGTVECPGCGRMAPVGEKYCSQCGTKLSDAEQSEQAQSEQEQSDADNAEGTPGAERETGDILNEAGDIINEAADKAREFLSNAADNAAAFMKGVSSKLAEKADEDESVDEDEILDAEEILCEDEIVDGDDVTETAAEEAEKAAEESTPEAEDEETEEAAAQAKDPTQSAE